MHLFDDRFGIGLRWWRFFIIISDAESTAEIKIPDADSFILQPSDKGLYLVQGFQERFDLGQLRSDMATDAEDFDVIHPVGADIFLQCLIHGDTKLVLCQPGGDVGVGIRVNIGIDAERNRCRGTQFGGQFLQPVKLLGRFHVKE